MQVRCPPRIGWVKDIENWRSAEYSQGMSGSLQISCGRLLSIVFAGQAVGLKKVKEDTRLVSFVGYDRAYIDLQDKTLQPLEKPFSPKV